MEASATAEVAAEILEPLELRFSDLLLLSSAAPSHPPPSPAELARLESISAAAMQALGSSGPGLLAITEVPKAPDLRRLILPFARKLALLGRKDRARVLKEHGLGSDVPLKNLDRNVSSFALQLKYAHNLNSESSSIRSLCTEENHYYAEGNPVEDSFEKFDDKEFKILGSTFKELSLCMMELGLRLAQICDKAIDCRELKQSIMDGSAKGRLIHYHSTIDNIILKETNRTKKGSKKKVEPATLDPSPSDECTISRDFHEKTSVTHWYSESRSVKDRTSQITLSNLWQQWHYDYGIFTVLTSPSFMFSCLAEDCSHISCCRECSSPDEHTYLQLFDIKKNKIFVVRSPADSFIIQVGEAANILTSGKLQSTLHSVGRTVDMDNLSRQTFVVFLQPAWSKILSYSGYPEETSNHDKLVLRTEMTTSSKKEDAFLRYSTSDSKDSHQLMQEILRKIPPLSIRFRDGMTFAEFSHETTKQYYSSSGTQSMR
ncbi:unnamed protein product [Musa acuminata subsp. malaccensis]|uniref:(wild Malaysian banana) hypothetical protein n=1 Tax=Musa acuminata subsp. malaccensis TaxID=214687 RepID=A0A804IM76_MUSAM|nr:PREDICTED: uncharacterized protein LOC103980881 isoform X1 [Musa acuminata subsp. malaccensis]CAG1841505.1 unnamed protein product [Musa acuminata subsp. malaccensis]